MFDISIFLFVCDADFGIQRFDFWAVSGGINN